MVGVLVFARRLSSDDFLSGNVVNIRFRECEAIVSFNRRVQDPPYEKK
jgi:hypothetical protein